MNELMMPALSLRSFGLRDNSTFDHIAAGRRVLGFRSGRLALEEALARSGVGAGSDVLVPAYHCQSIVEPIEALGARAVFYRVLPDLSADFSDVVRKLTRDTKSVIAVHFFGISNDLSMMRGLCDEAGATLIEDCAHCFSYSRQAPSYGITGDFVITSPRKFLPIYDGGELFSPTRSLPEGRQRPFEFRYQLKIALNILERGWRRRGYGRKRPGLAGNYGLADFDTETEDASDSDGHEFPDYVDPRFDLTCTNFSPSVPSRCLTRTISLTRVEQIRARTFRKLEIASGSFRRGVRAFHGLDGIAVPYIFPVVLEREGDLIHSRLRRAGVPMWRWDDLRESDCEVSRHYSKSLIQLPCHQELSAEFLDRMVTTLQEVLG